MKKQIPTIILAIGCIVLAATLFKTKGENSQLREELSLSRTVAAEPGKAIAKAETVAEASPGATNQSATAFAEPEAAENQKESNRRMMSSIAKMMEDNPTINKMVEASQRGAIGALYSDLIEYLDLDAEETKYFMDLLMYRQMKNVDVHMKMMSGDLTEEEKAALMEEVKLANETTQEEMEKFLNDPEDFAESEFYEDTIGERMMLSQMDQMLGDAALSEETYREVLEIMHDERESFDWSTDLHDNENRDLSPERFSEENIQQHIADTKAAGELMDRRMQEILTPEQLAAWRQSGLAMQDMMIAQMQQAGQMFGGE